jgi:hypothetical protein
MLKMAAKNNRSEPVESASQDHAVDNAKNADSFLLHQLKHFENIFNFFIDKLVFTLTS